MQCSFTENQVDVSAFSHLLGWGWGVACQQDLLKIIYSNVKDCNAHRLLSELVSH